jgi:hypothetical protein
MQTIYRRLEPETIDALAANAAIQTDWFRVNNAYKAIKYGTPLVSTAVSAGNALIDSTVANCFGAPVGIDCSAYQTGTYAAAWYSGATLYLLARISSTAPSGEALSLTERITNGDMETGDPPTGYISRNSATLSRQGSGQAGNCLLVSRSTVNNPGAYKSYIETTGNLQKVTVYAKAKEEATASLYQSSDTAVSSGVVSQTAEAAADWSTQLSTYRTVMSGASVYVSMYVTASNGTDGAYFDTLSSRSVTMPAATGVLLESSPGVRGYIYKHASFDPNAASTFKIFYVGAP